MNEALNHALVAAQALRFRFRTIHDVPPDDASYDVERLAAVAVSCGDPVIDSAIRQIGSAWVRAGLSPERMLAPWEGDDVRALFVENPHLLDRVDEILGGSLQTSSS